MLTEEQINEALDNHPDKIYQGYGFSTKKDAFRGGFKDGVVFTQEQLAPKWIAITERLPSLAERDLENNWKFSVSNVKDNWVDAAYFDGKTWNNGECEILPTHWMPLPTPPESNGE